MSYPLVVICRHRCFTFEIHATPQSSSHSLITRQVTLHPHRAFLTQRLATVCGGCACAAGAPGLTFALSRSGPSVFRRMVFSRVFPSPKWAPWKNNLTEPRVNDNDKKQEGGASSETRSKKSTGKSIGGRRCSARQHLSLQTNIGVRARSTCAERTSDRDTSTYAYQNPSNASKIRQAELVLALSRLSNDISFQITKCRRQNSSTNLLHQVARTTTPHTITSRPVTYL